MSPVSMKGKMNKAVILILSAMSFCGCAKTYYYVNKVPKTPGNLDAYRECQRTVAAAAGYDKYGYKDLTRKCLDTLEGVKTEFAAGDKALKKILPGDNCRQLESITYGGYRAYFYYLCE